MNNHGGRFAARFLLLACCLLAGSCAARPGGVAAPVKPPRAFSRTGVAAVPDRWWTALGDTSLNRLMDEALAGNFTIRTAWARLDQARAVALKSGADVYPGLSAEGRGSRTRTETSAATAGSAASTSSDGDGVTYQNSFALGLTVSYELDLWGRVRSLRDAAALDFCASREDLHAAAMTVSAAVADTWYRLLEQRGQLALLARQEKTNQDYLELVTLRFRKGRSPAADVLRQRQLLESTKGEKARAEAGLKVLEHQLSILLGKAPGAVDGGKNRTLPDLPGLPKTGLPAELLKKRPDVRAAAARVRAADERSDAAAADRFPKISLSASADTSSSRFHDLFDDWLATLAANVAAPLLDGGRRAAEVDRTRAVTAERVAVYGQAVLNAFKEVEDALVQETQQGLFTASLERQAELSRQVVVQVRTRYTKGASDYLHVLDALRSRQSLERSLLSAKRQLVGYRIDLYRALGGAWPLDRPGRIGKKSGKKDERIRSDDGKRKPERR